MYNSKRDFTRPLRIWLSICVVVDNCSTLICRELQNVLMRDAARQYSLRVNYCCQVVDGRAIARVASDQYEVLREIERYARLADIPCL